MANKRLISSLLAATVIAGLSMGTANAQSRGDDSEVRDLESFDQVVLEGSFDVIVNIGGGQSVTLYGDEDDFDNVETRVRRGTLTISWDRDGQRWRDHDDVNIEISVPSLVGFGIEGSGDVEISDIDAEDFHIQIAGSGDMLVDGQCNSLEIDIAGSGDVEGEDLICASVSVEIAGSGDVEVTANDSIDIEINGSGDVIVYGSPSGVRLRQRGSGDIEIVESR